MAWKGCNNYTNMIYNDNDKIFIIKKLIIIVEYLKL